jgi:hypothetical protein
LAGESELTHAGWRLSHPPAGRSRLCAPAPPETEAFGGENFLLAILRVLLYQILALLGERELGEQYGQQGEA